MRGVKGTAFLGHCVDCKKELAGIRPNRFTSNPNRRCWPCHKKAQPGFHLNEGYVRRSDKKYEHRIVAERLIGRPLTHKERVHHINEVRTDNAGFNLKVCASAGAHVWGEGHVSRNEKGRFCPNADDFRKKK